MQRVTIQCIGIVYLRTMYGTIQENVRRHNRLANKYDRRTREQAVHRGNKKATRQTRQIFSFENCLILENSLFHEKGYSRK